MTPNIYNWVKIHRPSFVGDVLEIGSLNVNGGVRDLFSDASSYVGIDVVMGRGVDVVMSGHDIKKMYGRAFDTIICLETIEHDPKFWNLILNIKECLLPAGTLLLSSPTIGFPLHHKPDYYRFTVDGIKSLIDFADCDLIAIDSLPDTIGNHSIIAKGEKR